MRSVMDKRNQALPLSIFVCLALTVCSGGGSGGGAGGGSGGAGGGGGIVPAPTTGVVVGGAVQAPNGQVALFDQPSVWDQLASAVWPDALAGVSGLSPVPDGAQVQLVRINQAGDTIATLAATTVTAGRYSFNLTNLGISIANDLAVRAINLATGVQMRAFVTGTTVNIDPVSEATVRLVIDQVALNLGKTLHQFTATELRDIRTAVNLLTTVKQATAGLNLEITVASIQNAVASDAELMASITSILTSPTIDAPRRLRGEVVSIDDYVDFPTAATACANKTLIIPFRTPVFSNTTVDATCTLWFVGPGQLSVASGVIVAINGPIVAPLAKIFTLTGTGTVSLTSNARISYVFPQWWGGMPDGSTDNTAALQATVNASAGRIVFLSGGTWVLGNAGANKVTYRSTGHYYCVKLPSNTTLLIDDAATVTQADSANSHLFVNTDIAGAGNSNIVIQGGTFDLNRANQTNPATGEQSGGLFHNVSGLTIENVKFTNVREYALRITGVSHGRFVNLYSTDSDGSGFAFGVDSTGWSDFDYGMTDSFFDYIVAEKSLGGFTGAVGNGFILFGQRCHIGHVTAYDNAFGVKIQDRSKNIQVDSVIAHNTARDHGFKVQGNSSAGRAQWITVGKVQTAGNYHAGVYLQYAQDVTVGTIDSDGDGISTVYPAVWIGEGLRFNLDSITINAPISKGLLIRPDAQLVNIGTLTIQ